jgi:hypothetical protein
VRFDRDGLAWASRRLSGGPHSETVKVITHSKSSYSPLYRSDLGIAMLTRLSRHDQLSALSGESDTQLSSLLVTISGFDRAVGGSLILLARCEGGSTGGIEIFPHSGTGLLAISGGRERTTHHWANL